MSKYIVSLAVLFLTACGSTPTEKPAESSVTAPAAAAPAHEKADDDSASRVLNKNKKCPKNTKIVNGKCVLQVESTE